MAESEKAMEMRHARTLKKLAGEELREARGMAKGGKTNSQMRTLGRGLAKVANQKKSSFKKSTRGR